MNKVRDISIDFMKFISINMMVWTHIGLWGSAFIHIFNMPVFFMISAIFFTDVKDIGELKEFIIKKIKGLYIPYIIFNLLFLLFHNLFININFLTNNIEILDYYPDFKIYNYYSVSDFFKRFILILSFVGGTQLGGSTWFLRSLFFSSILYSIVNIIICKFFINERRKMIIHLLIGVFFLLLSVFLRRISFIFLERDMILYINQILIPYILFPIGKILYKNKSVLMGNNKMLLCSAFILIVLTRFNLIHKIAEGDVYNVFLFIIGAVSGFILLYLISFLMTSCPLISRISSCGKYTLYVVGLHILWFRFINIIVVLSMKAPLYFIALSPTAIRLLKNFTCKLFFGIIYLFVGIIFSLLVGFLVEQYKRKITL